METTRCTGCRETLGKKYGKIADDECLKIFSKIKAEIEAEIVSAAKRGRRNIIFVSNECVPTRETQNRIIEWCKTEDIKCGWQFKSHIGYCADISF